MKGQDLKATAFQHWRGSSIGYSPGLSIRWLRVRVPSASLGLEESPNGNAGEGFSSRFLTVPEWPK